MGTLDFQFRDSPLSPVFAGLEDNLELSSSASVSLSSDMDLFKYFLNEEELDATSSETGSPIYDSLNSSPPVPSPIEFDPQRSPSPQHATITIPPTSLNTTTTSTHAIPVAFLPVQIKSEPIEEPFEASIDKKRKIKEEEAAIQRPHMPPIVPKGLEGSFSPSPSAPDEDRHAKRQRRLIKNRESAQLSRMRKKIYIDDLERKVTALTQENEMLTKKVASLVGDNKLLTEQVNRLESMLKQSQRRTAATTAATTNKNLKTAGVCMLMILFSFGLFFNLKGGDKYREQFHVGRMLTSIEDTQSTVPTSGSFGSSSSSSEHSAVIPQRNLPRKRPSEEKEGTGKGPMLKKREASDGSPVAPRKKVIKIQNTDEIEMVPEAGLVPVSHPQVPAAVEASAGLPQLSRPIVRRPDTNYIYCSEPQNVFADSSRRDESGRVINQPLVSLLMPANHLNATFNAGGYESDDVGTHALLEITCQIMNINVYPVIPLANQTVS